MVIGEVVIHCPEEVFRLDGLDAERHLNTLVLQRTDVLPSLITESRQGHRRSVVQQIGSLTVIDIDAGSETLVEQTEVETNIIGCSGLPLQVWCIVVRTIEYAVTCHRIETVGTSANGVCRNPCIVAVHILLTSLTIAKTEFQVTQCIDVLQESLLIHLPCQCDRGEE